MKHALLLGLLAIGSLVAVSALGIWQGSIIYANEGCSLGGCAITAIQWDKAVQFGIVVGAVAAVAVIGLWALISLMLRSLRHRPKSRSGAPMPQSD